MSVLVGGIYRCRQSCKFAVGYFKKRLFFFCLFCLFFFLLWWFWDIRGEAEG